MKSTSFSAAFLCLAFWIATTAFACGEQKPLAKENSGDSTAKVMLASAQPGRGLEKLSPGKIDAAFEFAAHVAKGYKPVYSLMRDSLSRLLINEGKEATAINVARKAGVRKLFFVRADRFVNMLRVETAMLSAPDYKKEVRGTGYALLRYRTEATNEILYDPSLLEALQRSMMQVENSPALFDNAEGKLAIAPAPTLVIGGLDYRDDDNLSLWKIFKDKTVTSYDAVQTIFQLVKDHPRYVAYDTDTRDSIYRLNGLLIPENYNPPSEPELNSLLKFEVQRYITGRCLRTHDGILLTLHLCALEPEGLKILKTQEDRVANDNMDEFRAALTRATRKLID